jgi:DNA-binding XRE family transcriptional regulator
VAKRKQQQHFGDRLKAIRVAAGLSQAELSRRADCRKASICEIEQGKQQPTWETAVKLIEACGGVIEIRRLN